VLADEERGMAIPSRPDSEKMFAHIFAQTALLEDL